MKQGVGIFRIERCEPFGVSFCPDHEVRCFKSSLWTLLRGKVGTFVTQAVPINGPNAPVKP